ncbi:MAG: hypothetical protein ACRC0F_07950 [Cetobacterium sp.]
MKKTALLFLALSAFAFGGASTTGGANTNNTPTSSTVNVNVSATVFSEMPDFIITDSLGAPISSVNFEHILKVGDIAGQVQETLTTNIRAKGVSLAEGTLATKFGTDSLTLNNVTAPANDLNSALLAAENGFDAQGAIFDISSKLSGTAAVGTYNTQTTTLTITYNKTTPETR